MLLLFLDLNSTLWYVFYYFVHAFFFVFNVNPCLSLFRKKKLKLYSLWLMYFQINKTLVVLSGCAVPAQTAAGGSLMEPRCWDPSGCSRRDGAGGAAPKPWGLGVPWGFYLCFQDRWGKPVQSWPRPGEDQLLSAAREGDLCRASVCSWSSLWAPRKSHGKMALEQFSVWNKLL